MQLRPYQQEAIDAVYDAYLKDGISSSIVALATGLGKTFVAGNITKQLPARLNCFGRVLWLTHRENLVDQSAISVIRVHFPDHADVASLLIGEAGGIVNFMTGTHGLFGDPDLLPTHQLLKKEVGIVKQKLFSIEPKFVVASVQTIINRLDKIPVDHFDMIIVDECHRAMSNQWVTVLQTLKAKIIVGLSATPERLDGLSLGDLFDKIVIDRDIKFGIENKYLCEIEAVQVKTTVNLDSVKSIGGDLNQADLRIVDCDERNNQIVDEWLKYSGSPCGRFRRKTIGFCVDMLHAKNLAQAFVDRGIKATFVVSDENICPDRKYRTQGFQDGIFDVMLNVDIFVEGADFHNVGMTIAANPTKSKTKFMQGPIGRGTRLKDAKFIEIFGANNCIVLDITDNCKKHSLVNTWSLDNGKRIEDRVFMGAARKADLIGQRDKRKLEHEQKTTERFNLLSLPVIVVQMNSEWMRKDPSEAQITYLKSLGLYSEGNHYTMGQVSELIANSPARYQDALYAQKHGYDISGGISRAQFEKCKAEIAARLNKAALNMSPLYSNSPFVNLG